MITLHGWDISYSMLVTGFGQGLAYAVLAAGIVLIFRASGVLNFAVGALGIFGVSLMAVLLGFVHMPYFLALALVTIACALVGGIAEFTIIRRLFEAPRLVLLVATLGISQLITFGAGALPDLEVGGPFPTMVPWSWEVSPQLLFQSRDISVFIAAPLLILGLGLFLTRTRYGLMIRAAASNADKSRLNGIRVRRSSTMVWALAGSFAGVTAVVLAPLQNLSLSGATNLGASGSGGFELLIRAFLVALIARMQSLPLTIAGGLIVGFGEALILNNVDPTAFQAVNLALFLGTVAMVLTFKPSGRAKDENWNVSPKVKPLPERVKAVWWMRHAPKMGLALALVVLALMPVFFTAPSQAYLWTRVVIFAIAGCSLTVLTGWAGQLSMGQFGFAALGGLTTLTLVQGNSIPVPFGLWDVSWKVPWFGAILAGMIVGALVAVVIGLPALRIPGLYLAIVSLAFAICMSLYVFSRPVFLPEGGIFAPFPKPDFLGIDFEARRSFFYLCYFFLLVSLVLVAQLRRTGIGRAIVAVRTNEPSAAAHTVSPVRMKLLAFGLSGALASLAGGLLITLVIAADGASTFSADDSVRTVAISIIGGLGTIAGPLLGSMWVIGIPALTGGSVSSNLFVGSIGLLILLLYFPGGLVQIGYGLRDALARYVEKRLPEETGRQRKADTVPAQLTVRRHDVDESLAYWLKTTDVKVRFGGRVAVDDVSIEVKPREFVGLIGTNGAGKSTLMNAISGFTPAAGRIEILGKDVAHLNAPQRHRLGLGRGFQAAKLYADLTVRETILVALEAKEKSLFFPSLLNLPPSPRAEREKRSEADEIISYLGLGRFADQFISNLSTGTRRITELACQLAVAPRVLLLDEPTGGLAQRETEAFGPLIKGIQKELDAAVLLIEHDMPLVMSISDRVYCLEAGAVISEGFPDLVRNDPRVIASYLGTDERTIQRSNAGQPATEPASAAARTRRSEPLRSDAEPEPEPV